jgi:C4-dicarboxylate-specific signal transduction histidine kinase
VQPIDGLACIACECCLPLKATVRYSEGLGEYRKGSFKSFLTRESGGFWAMNDQDGPSEANTRGAAFFKKSYVRMATLGKMGVWECDLATEDLTWTDTVYDLFDLPRQSAINRAKTLACYEPHSRSELMRLRAAAIANCSRFTVDVALITEMGNSRWLRITGEVEQEDGKAARIFGTKQDITLEKEAQIKVQALQSELIHASRFSAIEAMRSTLANELNQPLAGLALYVSAMRSILGNGAMDENTREVLDGMEGCAFRAAMVMRDICNMPWQQPKKSIKFTLSEAISEALTIALMNNSDAIQLTQTGHRAMTVIGDSIQIQQVLINLIRNACEALSGCERPEIVIATKMHDQFVSISVCDNGPGIAPDLMATLFDAFVTTKPDRSGLGLSISQTIIEGHAGKLTAVNHPKGGANFCFTLPLEPNVFIR